jgi:toxin ParE1/3/4
MKPIILHPFAYDEVHDAAARYEDRVSGLGVAFLEEVNKIMASVQESPGSWPAYRNGVRRLRLHRFPYLVVYTELEAEIWVIAVAHGSRRPGYWNNRSIPPP